MKYVMNSKKGDYRVLPWHTGLDENTDYIHVSEDDAKAVMAKKKTGAQVMKEIFLRNRMEEVESVKTEAEPVKTEAEPVKNEVTPKPHVDDGLPPANTEDPLLDFTNMTITGLHTLKVGDLRRFAREKFDLAFAPGTSKDTMIAQLIVKMDEAK